MCEFISWVEKDNRLFYLTDKEVFSKQGKKALKGCKDNDFIGHGAIRTYFMIDGTDKEQRDFWNLTEPKELADKLKEFDKHWGKMLKSGYFMNDDLRYIIDYASDKWRAKASEQLLTQQPSNDDLRYIITYASDKWRVKAWQQLLTQQPSNTDLRHIVINASDKWRAKAWQQLLTQQPSNDDLRYIVTYASDKWRAKARKLIK